MPLLQDFCQIFKVPDFVIPYLHFFVTQEEMRLVAALAKARLSQPAIAAQMRKTEEDAAALLERAYLRYIVDKEHRSGTDYYTAGDFYARLNHFCQFGDYYVIPRKVRQALDEWDFAEYVRRNDHFRQVLERGPEYDHCHNEWILPLEEVEAMIDAASIVRLMPCNCKMLADNCDHSREICLALDAAQITARSVGRDISKAAAKKLARKLDQEGLIHTGGPYNWRSAGPQVVCNCCTCCCYPFRAAAKFKTKGRWPKSRYVAVYDEKRCVQCGLCAKRCGFAAFTYDGGRVSFHQARCWGCGICANACPKGAIQLIPLEP